MAHDSPHKAKSVLNGWEMLTGSNTSANEGACATTVGTTPSTAFTTTEYTRA